MTEHTYITLSGTIHYWINADAAHKAPQLVFLPGLTADHRLFDKQIEAFEGKHAGHNSNTDKPEVVNALIQSFVKTIVED